MPFNICFELIIFFVQREERSEYTHKNRIINIELFSTGLNMFCHVGYTLKCMGAAWCPLYLCILLG